MKVIADGGAVWTNEKVSGKVFFSPERYGELAKDDYVGHFAYLEGQVLFLTLFINLILFIVCYIIFV